MTDAFKIWFTGNLSFEEIKEFNLFAERNNFVMLLQDNGNLIFERVKKE